MLGENIFNIPSGGSVMVCVVVSVTTKSRDVSWTSGLKAEGRKNRVMHLGPEHIQDISGDKSNSKALF